MATSTKLREPHVSDILKVIHEAVSEYDQSDKEHREIETAYHDESETLVVQVMHAHHVDIFSVTVKYDTTFSG